MTTEAVFSSFDGILGGLVGMLIPIMVFVLFGAIAYAAYVYGFFKNWKYKVILFIPRAGNRWKQLDAKGRYLPSDKGKDSGKFEIKYGFNNEVKVNAPNENCIHEGDIIYAESLTREKVNWLGGPEIDSEKKTQKYDSVLSPNMELAFANQYALGYEATHKQDMMMQYFPVMMFLVGAMILGGALILGQNIQADSNMQLAESNKGLSSQIQSIFRDTTVVAYRDAPEEVRPVERPPMTETPGG